jgi:myo-inositol-1(or 4)-monophosphatase
MEEVFTMRMEEIKDISRELSSQVRELVRPQLGDPQARRMMGRGASGDSTFAIDELAEVQVGKWLEDFPEIAYFSEDRGFVGGKDARWVLVIDPIDGTRPAAAGLEACCISIAVSEYHPSHNPNPTMGDVAFGLIQEIKNEAVFEAERGKGCSVILDGDRREVAITSQEDISDLFWTMGFRGRPALPLVLVLEELIDRSSVDGGLFDLGSATFCITRLITGQLDAYVDVGDRILRELPQLEDMFRHAGHGHVLNNSSYDLAAAALIASEAGLSVSDAFGKPLHSYPLLVSGRSGQLSCVAAVSDSLLDTIIGELDAGMKRMRDHYGWS